MIIAALFRVAKTWKQPNCQQVNEYRKGGIYVQWACIQCEKEGNPAFATPGKEVEGIMLHEISQTQRDK